MTFKWFEKHQKGLLVVLTVFTVLTFSITGAIYGLFDDSGADSDVPEVAGTFRPPSTGETIEVSTEDFYAKLRMLHTIESTFSGQSNVDNRAVWRHIVILDEARRNGVYVSDNELIDFMKQALPISKENYDNLLRRMQLTPALFEEYLREILIVQKFTRLDYHAFVTDKEIFDNFRSSNDNYELEFVAFPWKGAAADIQPDQVTDDQLTEFYDELEPVNKAEFRQEDEVAFRMAYLAFADAEPDSIQTNLPEGTPEPTEEDLKAYYERNKFRFRKPEPTKDDESESSEGDEGETPAEDDGAEDEAGDPPPTEDGKSKEKEDGGFYFSESSVQEQESETPPAESETEEGQTPEGETPTEENQKPEGETPTEESPTPEDETPTEEGQTPEGETPTEENQTPEDETPKPPEDPYKTFEEVRDEVLRRFQVERLISKFIEQARVAEDKTFAELAIEMGLRLYEGKTPASRTALEKLFKEMEIDGNGSVISHLFFTPVNSVYGRVVDNEKIGAAVEPTERRENLFKPLEEVRERILEMWISKQNEDAAKKQAETLVTAMKAKVEGEFTDQIELLRTSTQDTIERRISVEVTEAADNATDDEKKAVEDQKQAIRAQEEKFLEEGIDAILAEPASAKFAEAAQELGLTVAKTESFRSSFSGSPAHQLMEDGPEKYLKGPLFSAALRQLVPTDAVDADNPLEAQPGLATMVPVRDQENEHFYIVRLASVSDPSPADMTPTEYQSARQLREFIINNIQGERKWNFDFLKAANTFNIESVLPVDDPNQAARGAGSPR